MVIHIYVPNNTDRLEDVKTYSTEKKMNYMYYLVGVLKTTISMFDKTSR
jgi:hypothetical protein